MIDPLHEHYEELFRAAEDRGMSLLRLDGEIPPSATFMVKGEHGILGYVEFRTEFDLLGLVKEFERK